MKISLYMGNPTGDIKEIRRSDFFKLFLLSILNFYLYSIEFIVNVIDRPYKKQLTECKQRSTNVNLLNCRQNTTKSKK